MTEGDRIPVELIRENGVIRQIRLVCPCGQAIAVDCEYDEIL